MPQDYWYECGRCGSIIKFLPCQDCEGAGYLFGNNVFDEGEQCSTCDGQASFPICSSAPEWCESHPMPGQEETERSSLGEFCIGGK